MVNNLKIFKKVILGGWNGVDEAVLISLTLMFLFLIYLTLFISPYFVFGVIFLELSILIGLEYRLTHRRVRYVEVKDGK